MAGKVRGTPSCFAGVFHTSRWTAPAALKCLSTDSAARKLGRLREAVSLRRRTDRHPRRFANDGTLASRSCSRRSVPFQTRRAPAIRSSATWVSSISSSPAAPWLLHADHGPEPADAGRAAALPMSSTRNHAFPGSGLASGRLDLFGRASCARGASCSPGSMTLSGWRVHDPRWRPLARATDLRWSCCDPPGSAVGRCRTWEGLGTDLCGRRSSRPVPLPLYRQARSQAKRRAVLVTGAGSCAFAVCATGRAGAREPPPA